MSLLFGNLLGLWALLGIPAILLIHFLQRELRRAPCTTLFLLDPLEKESASGSRFEWIRNSLPLWLQLLCVLLLTWVLLQPRWKRPDSVQPIAFVLDASASMSAFSGEARQQVGDKARFLARSASRTEFFLLESSLDRESLYRGASWEELTQSLESWSPQRGHHDVTPALRVARSLVGRQGLVVLVTDHRPDSLPFDAHLLAVGSPKSNVGFAGVEVKDSEQGPSWRALVRNHSERPEERQWHLSSGNERSSPQNLSLQPGEIRALTGRFPNGEESVTLHLSEDAFPLDDHLPILTSRERHLLIQFRVLPRSESLVQSLLPALLPADLVSPETNPDLQLIGYDPLQPDWPEGPAIVFVDRDPKLSTPEAGGLVSADHPLMEELRWEALTLLSDVGIPFRTGDTVLLWQEQTPLIWLRDLPGSVHPQLVLNFDLTSSNVLKLPAFILLCHRYGEQIRQTKLSLAHQTAETLQTLTLPEPLAALPLSARFTPWNGMDSLPLPVLVPPSSAPRFTLPAEPGFTTLTLDGKPILKLASHFADTREMNLSAALSTDELQELSPAQVERYTESDGYWVLWILLLTGVQVASWAWLGRDADYSRSASPRSTI